MGEIPRPRLALLAAVCAVGFAVLAPAPPRALAHARIAPAALAPLAPEVRTAASECNPPFPTQGCEGLRPQDLHSAYALPPASPALEAVEKTQTIALVDANDDPTIEKDLNKYDEEFGFSEACDRADGCFRKVNQEGKTQPLPPVNGEAAREISLDVEVAHAVCPHCHILLVEAAAPTDADFEIAEDRAVAMGATEISNSWFTTEPVKDSAAFNHPGVVITAASGDEGYLNWSFKGESGPEEPGKGEANYPASSPHVVAVGGTHLELTPSKLWQAEYPWNGEKGATGSACSHYYTAPPWQQELGDWSSIGCGSKRAVVDIAAIADPWHSGVAVYDSTPDGRETPYWHRAGGTSAASPIIAAMFALAGGAGGVEYPAKTLYENAVSTPGSLHDIESGSNGECTEPLDAEGFNGCTLAEEGASCAGTSICVAGPGYDGPSGVGTPDGIGAFEPTGEPGKEAQAIEFNSSPPAKATVGASTYTVAATASSGLVVTFTSGTPFACSVEGSVVTPLGAGTCTVDADQAGNPTYKEAPQAKQSFEVVKSSQKITFTSPPPSMAAVGGPPYSVSATASSGLPVTFSSESPGVCLAEGTTVEFDGAGECVLYAEQGGSEGYRPAHERQSFIVHKGSQTIVFTSSVPGTATVHGPASTVTASASSGLAVGISSESSSVCTVPSGSTGEGAMVEFVGTGTCTILASQEGNLDFEPAAFVRQSFTVSRKTQSIEFTSSPPAPASVAGAPYAVSATASSGLTPVKFSSEAPSVCAVDGSTVSFLAAGECTIVAHQEGGQEYEPAPPVKQSFTVARSGQRITFTTTPPASASAGGPSYLVGATASSGLPVSLSSTTLSVCSVEGSSVSFAAAGMCTIDASQEGDGAYAPAPEAQQSFTVGPNEALLAAAPNAMVSTLGFVSSPAPLPAPRPDSAFGVLGKPSVNHRTGTITLETSVLNGGTFRWLLTVPLRGSAAVGAHGGHCSAASRATHGGCPSAKIVFARGSRAMGAAGTMKLTIKPGAAAWRALEHFGASGRAGVVTAALSFQSSLGGVPVSHTLVILDRITTRGSDRRR